ncbi:MAG: hypothetical protein A3E60_00405 [Candidatus Kerfeldbacteria bacterium RIFCSPHIGHO2_12_FULL_42_13]|uniref:Uncharacterized protein n=1 Tax=Candidatus Daviesbacteria bacterium RIFCSPLOWO2_02_FULL_38_15 TaxID=1797794 RepID=A0A1F5N5N0_9BACT|nr:MAG: hypothetical protein A3H40_02665 [Candidatus Daviesbacteria bacterium RIFCSPLOWO2_02_FULL_38_15]OGY82384.1 MAG: hypothetical protein A3E60_00405 [Candidatus Kerfeldbacteria bacterium RIFCSPHIGHO2_12_FULL_42_13]
MLQRKNIFAILILSFIGIFFYFIPQISQHPPRILIFFGLLAVASTFISLREDNKTSDILFFVRPLFANVFFFIPLILVEWISIKSDGIIKNPFGVAVDAYQHYSFMPLYATLLSLSLGIAGMCIQLFRKTYYRKKS